MEDVKSKPYSSIKEGSVMMRAPQVSYGYVTVTFSNLRIAHDDVT